MRLDEKNCFKIIIYFRVYIHGVVIMGKHYSHISAENRIKLYELLYKGMTLANISLLLGYHKSTIYRELERNSYMSGYRPDWANTEYGNRRRSQYKSKIEKNPDLKNYIIAKLQAGWSPELISGRLRLENNGKCIISYATIYNYIYSAHGKSLKLYKLLKKQRRFRYPRIKRRKYTKSQQKPSIKDREEYINNRTEFGHWEGDLIVFTNLKNNIITLRERKSRYIKAIKNQSRKSLSTLNTLVRYMKNAPIKTLTLDNDPAFAHYREIEATLNTKVYFCEPYKSYQKGTVENANRLLREDLPRKTNISKVKQDQIDKIACKHNIRPMKCLGYKTPMEVYHENIIL